MQKKKIWILLLWLAASLMTASGQSLPGDSVVFGPMFSPVYHDSVRVWVLTKAATGTGNVLTLDVTAGNAPTVPLTGVVHNSDDRLGYSLRSYVYASLVPGESYTAVVKQNGVATQRKSVIRHEHGLLDDFEFLGGGCARIYDTTRCIDRPESQTHVNGDPAIFNKMAAENSDLMVWLGDATYLLGLQHAMGQCPDGIDDWANKDMAFARYLFYRSFHDSLLRAMPQLAITDNHDTGPNEFNKTMPTLGEMREIFMDWWPNPAYNSTSEGQGLFSSYRYKDVEYFLLDNRSYRDGIQQQLGPEQLEWLKQGLLHSTASFKILISGTPSFAKHWGGRNFAVTSQADELVQFIKSNNIDGVLCLSADIHEQEFYGRYGDASYPLFDVLSGNLNSDIGNGQITVDYTSDRILRGTRQTYLRVNVYGEAGDRRMKIAYVGLNGQPYFETILHADMLRSVDDSTRKIALSFNGSLKDSSAYDHQLQMSGLTYQNDKDGNPQGAAAFTSASSVKVPYTKALDLNNRSFSLSFRINATGLSATGTDIFSNGVISIGYNKDGYLQYADLSAGTTYTSSHNLITGKWAHITWKYDNVKRALSLYYNGSQIQTWANVATPAASSNAVSIGKGFTGLLDEITLYGKLISDARIREESGYTSHRGDVLQVSAVSKMKIPANVVNTALAGDFTIEFWGRLNADPGTNYKILASNGRVNNNSTGLSFEFPDNNKMNIVIGNNGSGWNTISNKGVAWNIGEWNHVAVTATRNGMFTYYVNGEKTGETTFAAYVPNSFGMGMGFSPAYSGNLPAELDELRIWKAALPQDSIRKHMHYPLTGTETDLELYYNFSAYTNNSIISKGAQQTQITLDGGTLVPGTSPVADITLPYRSSLSANWSRNNTANAGLSFPDKISGYTSNIVTGKQADNTIRNLGASKDTFYVAGSWWFNALNMDAGNIQVDLAKLFSNPDSVAGHAKKYYLIKGDPSSSYTIAATGNAANNIVLFENVPLSTGGYYLGYSSSAIAATGTFKVNAGTDDAEQDITAGTMYLTSSDLEFTKDGASNQLLGLRFTNVDIPQGAIINNAYIQFTVDEVNTSGNVNVLIGVENVDNPLTMTTFDFDIYHRIVSLGDTIIWKPGPFATVGEAGLNQRTPDVSKLLQQIVNRTNWKSGNAVLFTMIDPASAGIPGYTANTAKRVAQAYENNAANAAKLVVSYVVPDRYNKGVFPIPAKASWKYNDSGTDLTGANWAAVDYNDSTWAWGNGILGYGEGNESTTLSFGSDATNKRPTYYLRHIFEVADHTQYDSLLFEVLRDDGAIVYVNGTEAFRMNMPDGVVNYNTYASTTVNDADEKAYFKVKTANLLKNGTNVIAVELHQASANSSDLSFDMAVGYQLPPLSPAAYPLPKNSGWHYLDNGSSLDNTEWKDTSFIDSRWAQGKGPLGYGDAMSTTISYGPDAAAKYITTYFRRVVMIDTATLSEQVQIGLRRDDGAIVYVNGAEVVRDNMPAGQVSYTTLSSTTVDGAAESTYYTFNVPKSVFRQGKNVIAVEIHNRDGSSSDLGFDLHMKNAPVINPPADCNGRHISCFTSIVPTAPTNKLIIADEHRFQMIFKQGEQYTNGAGAVPGNQDFTAYLPVNGSSVLGHLSVNHENTPGGVSILDLHYNDTTQLWVVDTTQPVDLYNNNLVTTTRNCSGGITPWGTIITSEESLNSGDLNGDGYEDVGWQVEIDPFTAKVSDHDNDGKQDKLWVMGRMNHENIVIAPDRRTAYYGEDGGTHCVYKFVADVPGNLSQGKTYVLSLDQPLVNDEPSGSSARWVELPNATQYDRNNMSAIAASVGGTNFNGVEDCDICPIDGKIYFTAKGKGRVYRFTDMGASADNFETFVGGMSYSISTKQGAYTEAWGGGNDNLAFDDKGNLWVLQDGDNNYIWVVRPDHTQSNPKVELFASMPAGGEPTGLTFSPDYRFGFVSVQHPAGSNVEQADAAEKKVRFDQSATIVFSLHENLGSQLPVAGFKADTTVVTAGNSVTFTDTSRYYPNSREWLFEGGEPATGSNVTEKVTYRTQGIYAVALRVANAIGKDTVTYSQYIEVIAPAPVVDFTADKLEVEKGSTVVFTDNSTNNPVTRNWAFSGGTPATSADMAPAIVYNAPGTYDVTLNATNRAGTGTLTRKHYIVVKEAQDTTTQPPVKGVKIYPNPTDGEITIDFTLQQGDNVSIALFDMAGRKLGQLDKLKASGTLQRLHFNVARYVKGAQALVLLIKSEHTTVRRIIFLTKP